MRWRLVAAFLILASVLVLGTMRHLHVSPGQLPDYAKDYVASVLRRGPLKDWIKSWYATPLTLKSLKLPPGFAITLFTRTESPRMMAFSPGGVLLATSESAGTVTAFPDPQRTGQASSPVNVLKDLNGPHGIAFHGKYLYIAEITRLVRYDWDEEHLRVSNPSEIAQLPPSLGGHLTRTILFANNRLYVSAGSSCNVCQENDPRRAAVSEMNEDGSQPRIFASGLRNSVGLAFNEKTGTIWATDNGRDWLGDNLPPDEINDLGAGGDFGWPYCYGNRIADTDFGGTPERCSSTIPPRVALQAHSAPLGLVFYTGKMFPAEYQGDLFVAFHGSWNRSVPTGYKVVRVKMDEHGEPTGVKDFITGWLPPGETRKGKWMGRPVGFAIAEDGSLYISDDGSGSIYRVTWQRQ
jgi:glucose/arabinose dehydrogenase